MDFASTLVLVILSVIVSGAVQIQCELPFRITVQG